MVLRTVLPPIHGSNNVLVVGKEAYISPIEVLKTSTGIVSVIKPVVWNTRQEYTYVTKRRI
jgi:hypothetical protein